MKILHKLKVLNLENLIIFRKEKFLGNCHFLQINQDQQVPVVLIIQKCMKLSNPTF